MNAIQYEEHFHIGIQIAIIHLANVITSVESPSFHHIFLQTLYMKKKYFKNSSNNKKSPFHSVSMQANVLYINSDSFDKISS